MRQDRFHLFVLAGTTSDLRYTEKLLRSSLKSRLKRIFDCRTSNIVIVNKYANGYIRAYPAVLGRCRRYHIW